jgi:uncharacterized membrane protein
MNRNGNRVADPRTAPRPVGRAPIAVAAMGWSWAVALLSTREHLTAVYTVLSAAPPLWGFFALSNASLAVVVLAGALLGVLAHAASKGSGQSVPSPTQWLLGAWVVPLADLVRCLGLRIPFTFFEPIVVAGITGAAVRGIVLAAGTRQTDGPTKGIASRGPIGAAPGWRRAWSILRSSSALQLAALWGLALAAAAWWYLESCRAYNDYLLGYNDFGHFAWRVVNTWEGRGFLMETPGWPAFWDHFNPGLALLAPLWGLWPDARLFFLIQAICLALPAPLVFAIARRLGFSPTAAWAWAVAYLCYPVAGQFNLNCTYGWHPVSLALPLLFAAMACLLRGWRVAAGGACLAACSFQEDVIAVLAFLSLSMALAAWRQRGDDRAASQPAAAIHNRFSWQGWLFVAAIFLTLLVAVFAFAPFARYQVGRFSRLGDSLPEVVLSPLLRPEVFWGTIFRPQNAYFLLALFVPLGLRELGRGWPGLLATVLPLAVLLAWGHAPATSIAFQYTTALVPVFFLAAMSGAALPRSVRVGNAAALGALAACALASTWFGALPWSRPTLTDVIHQTYPSDGSKEVIENRRAGSPGNKALSEIVARVGGPQSSVLATGRIASHLLGVRRLDTVAQAGDRWKDFQAEIGPSRSPIELFDFIVVDAAERFYQSPEQTAFILEHAQRAGYRLDGQRHGVIVWRRGEE